MARKLNGEGTAFLRKDGRWQASLQLEGVRQVVYGRTEGEARKKLHDLQRQASSHGLADAGKRTVADLMAAWLELSAPNWRPRTLADRQMTCRLHILPRLGTVRLSRLTPVRIQAAYTDLQAQGKLRTALKVHVALHRACKMAVLWGWLSHNPCEHVLRPGYHAPRKMIWSAEELGHFLDGAREHPFYPLWLLAVTTGGRLGELLGLTWDDLDLAAGRLTIRQSVQRVAGEWVFGNPKTRAGERIIGLPRETVMELKRHRACQVEQRLRMGGNWHNLNLVFTAQNGDVSCPSVAQHNLRRECQRLELLPIGMHGLRHLHASLLLNEGVPIPAVSQRLGHATPGVTMTIYAHEVKRRGEDQATEAIGRALRAR